MELGFRGVPVGPVFLLGLPVLFIAVVCASRAVAMPGYGMIHNDEDGDNDAKCYLRLTTSSDVDINEFISKFYTQLQPHTILVINILGGSGRPGELWKAPWGTNAIVDKILPDFKWIVKDFKDGISAGTLDGRISNIICHMEGWFGQHEDILLGEPMDDQKNQKINKSGGFIRIGVNNSRPYIPKGAPIDYVLAGSPIVVGNLWVVRQTWALEFTKKLLKTFEGELEDEAGIVACLDLARKTYNNLMYRAGTICYGTALEGMRYLIREEDLTTVKKDDNLAGFISEYAVMPLTSPIGWFSYIPPDFNL
ncbi:hypothetical protein Tco_0413757 [Tanacetum coccineum]